MALHEVGQTEPEQNMMISGNFPLDKAVIKGSSSFLFFLILGYFG